MLLWLPNSSKHSRGTFPEVLHRKSTQIWPHLAWEVSPVFNLCSLLFWDIKIKWIATWTIVGSFSRFGVILSGIKSSLRSMYQFVIVFLIQIYKYLFKWQPDAVERNKRAALNANLTWYWSIHLVCGGLSECWSHVWPEGGIQDSRSRGWPGACQYAKLSGSVTGSCLVSLTDQ